MIALAALLVAHPCPLPDHLVIAHRGASFDAPEETAAAFALARNLGADYLEMDIQRTRDGVLIALHDDTLDRTTNIATKIKRAGAHPDELTIAEIKELDAGSWFNEAHPERARAEFAGLRVLTLDEVVDVARGARLYIETKTPERYPGLERELVALLARRAVLDHVIFQSFSASSLEKLALLAPAVPRVFLVDAESTRKNGGPGATLDIAAAVGCGVGPKGTQSLALFTAQAHARGLVVHPWVVDADWQMALADALGVDGIFTNRPDIALARQGRLRKSVDDALAAAAPR